MAGQTPMAFIFLLKRLKRQPRLRWTLVKTYRVISSASVDTIWAKLSDVTDVSWNPMLSSIDAPLGLKAKPGLFFHAFSSWIPLPTQLFVETVQPQQFLSIRIFAFPGLEERITYQIASDVKGTFISYSIMLRGWLTPIIWPFLHFPAQKAAQTLAHAAEVKGQKPTQRSWF